MAQSVFRTKSLGSLARDDSRAFGLKRVLTAANLTVLGIGATFGGLVFILVGEAAARYAGPAVLISITIAAFVSVLATLCYAELASMVPVAGSAYTYSYVALGELPAYMIAVDLVVGAIAATAALAIGWASYVVSLLNRFGVHVEGLAGSPDFAAAFVVALLSVLLVIGIRESSTLNATVVPLKIVVLLSLAIAALPRLQSTTWMPPMADNSGAFGQFGWSGVFVAAGFLISLYLGADAVATAAEESKNPRRDLLIGIVASIGVTTIAYQLLTASLLATVGLSRLGVANPLSVAFNELGVAPWFSAAVELLIVISITPTILISLLGVSRVLYALSRDGLAPAFLTRVHHRYRTPYQTSIVVGVIVGLVALRLPLHAAALLAGLSVLLNFAIVSIGVLILRRQRPDIPRPFQVPLAPVLPLVCGACCIGLMVGLVLSDVASGLIWVVCIVGALIAYAAYGYRASRLRLIP